MLNTVDIIIIVAYFGVMFILESFFVILATFINYA